MQPRGNRGIPKTRQQLPYCVRELCADGDFSESDDEITESGIRIGSEPECGFAVEGTQADAAQSKSKTPGSRASKAATARGGYLKDDALYAWQDVAEAYTARTGLPMSADLAAKIAANAIRKLQIRIAHESLRWGDL